jgi:hypothetical protein
LAGHLPGIGCGSVTSTTSDRPAPVQIVESIPMSFNPLSSKINFHCPDVLRPWLRKDKSQKLAENAAERPPQPYETPLLHKGGDRRYLFFRLVSVEPRPDRNKGSEVREVSPEAEDTGVSGSVKLDVKIIPSDWNAEALGELFQNWDKDVQEDPKPATPFAGIASEVVEEGSQAYPNNVDIAGKNMAVVAPHSPVDGETQAKQLFDQADRTTDRAQAEALIKQGVALLQTIVNADPDTVRMACITLVQHYSKHYDGKWQKDAAPLFHSVLTMANVLATHRNALLDEYAKLVDFSRPGKTPGQEKILKDSHRQICYAHALYSHGYEMLCGFGEQWLTDPNCANDPTTMKLCKLAVDMTGQMCDVDFTYKNYNQAENISREVHELLRKGTDSTSPAVVEEAHAQMERFRVRVRSALNSTGKTAESAALLGYDRDRIVYGTPAGVIEHAPEVINALIRLGYTFTDKGEPVLLKM